ncbi:SRPBCC family protein [Actinoplanes sp. M2I2]|uniref:SRPBCC family protein n=1 Tax=Actinoplanes sp. M2I2 TaxID=1734444 RepID=UPI002020AE98|nr:SRPBCC family protein [Actinoplanes sp. M2I2]
MTNAPTGRLEGRDLVLTRTFPAGIDDVWASVTESDRTARWFGRWTGEAGPGRTVKVQMAYEEGTPWVEARIDACEPPRRLEVSTVDEVGAWHLELRLTAVEGGTELRLVHHLETTEGLGEVGPGWEYYLDNLVAAREDRPLPDFNDYYPSMKSHFEALAV